MAQVSVPGMPTKSFHMFNVRRYKPEILTRYMQTLGWEQVGQFPFSGSTTYPRGAFIFQKRLPKVKP